MSSILPRGLALAVGMVLFGNPLLFAQEIRIDPPDDKGKPVATPDRSFVYDPLADLRRSGEGDELQLGGPFYQSDATKAALAYLPPDLKLGPADIPDYAEQDREERLRDYVEALGRIPRLTATIFGMSCDLVSPLGYICHVPDTDCIVSVGFPPAFLCPF